MKIFKTTLNFSFVTRYRFLLIFYISLFWTAIDLIIVLTRTEPTYYSFTSAIALRSALVFIMSMLMGYLLVFQLRKRFRRYPLGLVFLIRSVIMLLAAYVVNYIIHTANIIFIFRMSIPEAFHRYGEDAFHIDWLFQKVAYWMLLFVMTQLAIEVNEKYSPGVFMDLMLGKYKRPRIEKRIVMFMDLKDSTPTAEKLGHEAYFGYIREFIYLISHAIIEFGGNIYQYVGDEVVTSWPYNKRNLRRCMDAVIYARKNLQKNSEKFRREYGIIPEFRVGIHVGDVTVGEIGLIKKDIAMSGDTMNTTARIRSACSELKEKFVVSKNFHDLIDLKSWQTESLGIIDLKGKEKGIELFSLKI